MDLAHLQFLAALAPPDPAWGGLGGMPLRADFRDYDLRWVPEVAANLGGAYPASFSLASYVRGVYDQGPTGACVAFSTCGLVSIDRNVEEGAWPNLDAATVYRENGGTGQNGVDPRQVLQYAQEKGLPIAGNLSLRDHITSYAFVPQQASVWEDTVKAAIFANRPVTLALLLPAQFGWTSGGAVTSGYHQVCLIGWGTDPAMGPFLELLNSWGPNWGQGGRGRVPIAFVTQNGFQQNHAYSYSVIDKVMMPPPPPPNKRMISATLRTDDGRISDTGVIPAGADADALTSPPSDALLDAELALLNQNRAAAGAGPLARDPRLDASAGKFATVLSNGAPFSHTSPDGSSFVDRIAREGIAPGYEGENIAGGFADAASVMAAWMNSPGHRANLLNGNFTHVGLGQDRGFWVQDLARLEVAPPPPPKKLVVSLSASPSGFSGSISPGAVPQSVVSVTITQPDGTTGSAQATVSGDPSPPPAGEAITSYTRADGTPASDFASGEPIRILGTFVLNNTERRITGRGLDFQNVQLEPAVITATCPVIQDADTVGIVVHMVHDFVDVMGPPISIKKQAPPPGPGPVASAVSPNHAAVGANVIVSGSGFDSSCFVIFSPGIRAARPAVNATAIAAIVPAGAISGPIHVSRHSDSTVSSDLPFTVDGSSPKPAPGPAPAPAPVPGNSLHISLDGSDANAGTAAAPLRTIQRATALAQPPAVIFLGPGVWSEPIVLRSGLTYDTDPAMRAILDGAGSGGSGIWGENVSDVTVQHLAVRRWRNLGHVMGGRNVRLLDCVLSEGATSGFWMSGVQGGEVARSVISQCGDWAKHGDDCFAFAGCSGLVIADNDVSKGAHAGIQCLNCSKTQILRNTVYSNGSSGIIAKDDPKVAGSGFDDGVIEGNFVQHSAYSDESAEGRRDAGIQIVGRLNRVARNRVRHCGGGIVLALGPDAAMLSNDNVIECNTVLEVEEAGIDLAGYGKAEFARRMTGNRIVGNIAWGAQGVDLRVQFRGGPALWGNVFEGNVAASAQALEGDAPPHDTADPKLDAVTLVSATYRDRGWAAA